MRLSASRPIAIHKRTANAPPSQTKGRGRLRVTADCSGARDMTVGFGDSVAVATSLTDELRATLATDVSGESTPTRQLGTTTMQSGSTSAPPSVIAQIAWRDDAFAFWSNSAMIDPTINNIVTFITKQSAKPRAFRNSVIFHLLYYMPVE